MVAVPCTCTWTSLSCVRTYVYVHVWCRLLYLERLRLEDASYMAVEPRLCDIRPVIYLARATLENAQLIAWQIKNSRASK